MITVIMWFGLVFFGWLFFFANLFYICDFHVCYYPSMNERHGLMMVDIIVNTPLTSKFGFLLLLLLFFHLTLTYWQVAAKWYALRNANFLLHMENSALFATVQVWMKPVWYCLNKNKSSNNEEGSENDT